MANVAPRVVGGGQQQNPQTITGLPGQQTTTSGKHAILWFIGGVLLVALAGPFPSVITLLVVILLVMVVLKNYQAYFAFFKG